MRLTGEKVEAMLIDELNEIGLPEMAASLDALYHSTQFLHLDSLSMLDAILTPEYQKRINSRLARRLRYAQLIGCPEDLQLCTDSSEREYLPNGIAETLSTMDFVKAGMNVCVLGASDSGKTYLSKALGINACTTYSVAYRHCEQLLEELVDLKEVNFKKYQSKVRRLVRTDLLILDDFLLHTVTEERELKVLHELLEKRSELRKSTIVCSQRDPDSWASMVMNDEVAANAILKRVTKHYTVYIKSKLKS